MSIEKKLVPELRFPGFEEEWREKKLEQLFEIGNGRDYKHLNFGDIPVYGSGGYMLSVNDYLHNGESACIGRKGTIDKPLFLTGKFWTVDTLFYTHSFKDCLPKYIYYVFQNIDWLKHNEAGGVPSLSKANIYQIKTAAPHPSEQQKIVSCLSSLDDIIDAQNKRLHALQNYKKGFLQSLIPKAGKSLPEIRFPEFFNSSEWTEEKLENLCFSISSGKEKMFKDGEYNLYGSTGIIGKTNTASYKGEYKTPVKISRGEERIFIWCFFLALFETEAWTDVQNAHFFIDDPVSSMDEHNIFITVESILKLIDDTYPKKKIFLTTHHIGLFSILADRLTKGGKSKKYEGDTAVFLLENMSNTELRLNGKNGAFLFHLHLLKTLEDAAKTELYSYHFVLMRQLLENIASFLGRGTISFVLQQIKLEEDANTVGDRIQSLSHKDAFKAQSNKMSSSDETLFREILEKLVAQYNFKI